jgi:hypothetical protein
MDVLTIVNFVQPNAIRAYTYPLEGVCKESPRKGAVDDVKRTYSRLWAAGLFSCGISSCAYSASRGIG